MADLTSRERRFLSLLTEPGATICTGMPGGYNSNGPATVGASLKRKGYVAIAKFGRLGITEAGRQALLVPAHEPKPRGRNAPHGRGNPAKSHAGGRGMAGGGTSPNGGMGQGQLPLF